MNLAFAVILEDHSLAKSLLEEVRAGGFEDVEPTLIPEASLSNATDSVATVPPPKHHVGAMLTGQRAAEQILKGEAA